MNYTLIDGDWIPEASAGVIGATGPTGLAAPVTFGYSLSDDVTPLAVAAAVLTARAPHAFTLTDVRVSLSTASSSGLPTFNVKHNGTTIFTTKVTVDATEKTSVTAATAKVLSITSIADDAELIFDIDVAGTGAKGAKIWLIGHL